jgi:hypothetical protein
MGGHLNRINYPALKNFLRSEIERRNKDKPVLRKWMGSEQAEDLRSLFATQGITFPSHSVAVEDNPNLFKEALISFSDDEPVGKAIKQYCEKEKPLATAIEIGYFLLTAIIGTSQVDAGIRNTIDLFCRELGRMIYSYEDIQEYQNGKYERDKRERLKKPYKLKLTPLHKAVKEGINEPNALKGKHLWDFIDYKAKEDPTIKPLTGWPDLPRKSYLSAYNAYNPNLKKWRSRLNSLVHRVRRYS